MSTLSQVVNGIQYNAPIVVASSPLTDSVDSIKAAEENGAGAVSTKLTMYDQPVKGVRKMYAVPGMYAFNPSDKRNDFEEGLELVRKVSEAVSIPIWTNIAGPGDNLEGWQKTALAFEQAGATLLELNFCCPNFAKADPNKPNQKVGAQIGSEPDTVGNIVDAVTKVVKIPVYPKIPTGGHIWTAVAKACETNGASGITIGGGGSPGAPPINIYKGGKPKMATMLTHSFGGYVGWANRMPGLARVAITYQNIGINICGGSGVSVWSDVVESMMYGSTLVYMCSKLLVDGFSCMKQMNKEILQFMEENGYETFSDMKGLAIQYLTTNDKIEYVNAPAKVDTSKCIGCGKCTHIPSCKAKLRLEGDKAVLDSDKCIFCGLCAAICPRDAISLE